MDFIKNIAVNLKATGPAAVFVVLIAGITLLGLYGQGKIAESALNILSATGIAMVFIFGQKIS